MVTSSHSLIASVYRDYIMNIFYQQFHNIEKKVVVYYGFDSAMDKTIELLNCMNLFKKS